jgi:hypothetical protein
VRELDERLGFGELIGQHLTDSRRGKNTQFPFADLLRQRWGRVASTAPTIGKNCCFPRSSGNKSWVRRSSFVPTRLSPSRRFTRRWRSGT